MREVQRVLALTLVLAWLWTAPVDAAPKWCEDDPVIVVNGHTAHVTVGFAEDNLPHVTGKITYFVVVAQSYYATTTVDASMASLPTQTYVYAVSDDSMKVWKGDKIKVVVFVNVPAKKNFVTVTTVTDFFQVVLERRGGKSNAWVEVDFNLR